MDERKLRILEAIIDDYISTAVPVGSRTISKKYGMGLSPATIRNEMSDLEELGYLAQPHVSAGRVPSPKAYRFYVDKLLADEGKEQQEQTQLAPRPQVKRQQIEEVMDNACKMLASVTGYTAAIIQPISQEPRVQTLQLVPISEGTALIVCICDNGTVKNSVIRLREVLDSDGLYAVSKFLTKQISGAKLSSAMRMVSAIDSAAGQHRDLLQGVGDFLRDYSADMTKPHVSVDGISNMLNYPEYSDVDKAHSFLAFMEDSEKVAALVNAPGQGSAFRVRIGSEETGVKEMEDCSVVTTSYSIWSGLVGTIGIIGPQRMQYQNVFSVLSAAGKQLSDMLARAGDSNK